MDKPQIGIGKGWSLKVVLSREISLQDELLLLSDIEQIIFVFGMIRVDDHIVSNNYSFKCVGVEYTPSEKLVNIVLE